MDGFTTPVTTAPSDRLADEAPPPSKLVARATLVAATAAVLAIGVAAYAELRPQTHVAYIAAPVTRGAVAPYVTASGTVNPVTTIQVGTYVSGVIQELRCDFNTEVRKGQLCAKIDPRPYQTIVDQDAALLSTAQAQLHKDQANTEFNRVMYERDRKLLESGLIAQEIADAANNDLQQSESQIELDKASIDQREAELSAAKVNLGYTDIVSPVDGTVVSRNVTQGQTVAASFTTPTLFVIAGDLTKMQVDANVSESDIGQVHLGGDAVFTVEAFPSQTFSGHVVQVRQSPQSVQNVVTYDVVSELPNADLLLKPGMTAAVRLVTDHHDDVVRVPAQALRYSPTQTTIDNQRATDEPHVWRLHDGAPVLTPIVAGLSDDSYVEITQGELQAGDRVVVGERTPGSGGNGNGNGGGRGTAPGAPTLPTRAPRL